MIGMWLFGDMYKVSYYEGKHSPMQLIICTFMACTVDCIILSQFWLYRKQTEVEAAKMKAVMDAVDTESVRDSVTLSTISGENNTPFEQSVDSDKGVELPDRPRI